MTPEDFTAYGSSSLYPWSCFSTTGIIAAPNNKEIKSILTWNESVNNVKLNANSVSTDVVNATGDINATGNIISNSAISAGSKVYMWTDNEGGNIELVSPSGVNWQMDAYNGHFRLTNPMAVDCTWSILLG